jgi:DNA replicative helicase MCM subunit Mcm2 (Cdc46/Mcm family)
LLRQADLNERSTTHNKVLPITIRSYETLIRLSTAHAKLHQCPEVRIKDCVEAFRLMIYCLEGDCHAMDDKLKEILTKLELYDPVYFPHDKEDHRQNKRHKKDHEKKLQSERKPADQKRM